MANTWSAWRTTSNKFVYPYKGCIAQTNAYIYKESLEKTNLKLSISVDVHAIKDGKGLDPSSSWSAFPCYLGANINFYDKNKNHISSSSLVNDHIIYQAAGATARKVMWNNGNGYNFNVPKYTSLIPYKSSILATSGRDLHSLITGYGITCFSDPPVSGEPLLTRYLQDDSSAKYPTRSRESMFYSLYSGSRPIPNPITVTITIPKNAAFFNVTVYGRNEDQFEGVSYAEVTFPDIGEASLNDNFLLDPYSKAYIKNGSWQDEPYYWYKSNASSGHDDGKGWDKTFAYYKNSSNWTEI